MQHGVCVCQAGSPHAATITGRFDAAVKDAWKKSGALQALEDGRCVALFLGALVPEDAAEEAAKHPAAHPHVMVTSSQKGLGIVELRAELTALTST